MTARGPARVADLLLPVVLTLASRNPKSANHFLALLPTSGPGERRVPSPREPDVTTAVVTP